MRISDWSSDVCSSDLRFLLAVRCRFAGARTQYRPGDEPRAGEPCAFRPRYLRSEHRVRPGRGCADRKSVVSGKSVSVRVDLGGRRIIKKKKTNDYICRTETKITQDDYIESEHT